MSFDRTSVYECMRHPHRPSRTSAQATMSVCRGIACIFKLSLDVHVWKGKIKTKQRRYFCITYGLLKNHLWSKWELLGFGGDNCCCKRQKCPWQSSLERTLLHTNSNLIWLPESINGIRKKTWVWYAMSNSICIRQWGSKECDGRERMKRTCLSSLRRKPVA